MFSVTRRRQGTARDAGCLTRPVPDDERCQGGGGEWETRKRPAVTDARRHGPDASPGCLNDKSRCGLMLMFLMVITAGSLMGAPLLLNPSTPKTTAAVAALGTLGLAMAVTLIWSFAG